MGKGKSAQGSDCHCLTIAIAIACQSFLSWLNLECYIPWSVFEDAIAINIAIAIANNNTIAIA